MLKFLKFIIALALVPFVAAEVWTLIDLARAAVPAGPWYEKWFVSLAAGVVTWLVIYVCLPRTMWLYVLGHEFTHALAAMIAGGKISAFHVSAKGGHVVTDRVNWWITLSPYFVPIYALIWMALWVTVDFYYPLRAWQPILYFGIGVLWCFHLSFTVSMIHFRQTDLASQGYIFSIVIIAMVNLLALLLLFAFLAHQFTLSGAGELFLQRVGQSYIYTGNQFGDGGHWLWSQWQSHRG